MDLHQEHPDPLPLRWTRVEERDKQEERLSKKAEREEERHQNFDSCGETSEQHTHTIQLAIQFCYTVPRESASFWVGNQ